MRNTKHNILLQVITSLALLFPYSRSQAARLYELSYSGRLTNSNGSPKSGPVNLELNFYRSEEGSDAIIAPLVYENLALAEGVFQVTISLSPDNAHFVFDGQNPVWVGVTVDNITYPRQKYMAVPFAYKIPIDEELLSYNSSGQLTINSGAFDAATSGSVQYDKTGNVSLSSSLVLSRADRIDGEFQFFNAGDLKFTYTDSKGTVNVVAFDKKGNMNVTGEVTSSKLNSQQVISQSLETSQVKLSSSSTSGGTDKKYVQLQAPNDISQDLTYTLPATITDDKYLTTDANGILSWDTPQDFAGTLTGDVTGGQKSTVVANVGGKSAATIAESVTTIQEATSESSASTLIKRDSSQNFKANAASLKKLELESSGLSLILQAPGSLSSSATYTLPSVVDPGKFLQTDVSGNLSWATPTAGTGSIGETAIADNAVSSAKIKDDAVTSAKIKNGEVATDDLANGAINNDKLADNAVTSAKIADATIAADDLADSAVGTDAIADSAVTSAKIADGTIVADDLASGAVGTDAIADGSIKLGDIADQSSSSSANTLVARDADSSFAAKNITADSLRLQDSTSMDDPKPAISFSAPAGLAASTSYTLPPELPDSAKFLQAGTDGTLTWATPSVSSSSISDDAINSAKIADGSIAAADFAVGAVSTTALADSSVTSAKIADGTIASVDIGDGVVTSAKIADGTVATADLAAAAVTSAKIADGNIGSTQLADSAVTSEKIAEGAVATGDLADGAVTSAKIADASIATGDLADGAVTSAKIADASIATGDLADGAVTSAKIADASIATGDLADGAVTSAKIADGSIGITDMAASAMSTTGTASTLAQRDTSGGLAAQNLQLEDADTHSISLKAPTNVAANITYTLPGTVSSGNYLTTDATGALSWSSVPIQDGAVTSAKIADGTIVAGDIATGAVTTSQILDGTIATGDIANSAVTTAKIADGSIATVDIADSAVTSAKLADNAVGTTELAAKAVTTAKVADSAIGTTQLAPDAVTSAKIADGTIVVGDIATTARGSAKTADTLVQRDSNGDFAAGKVTADEVNLGSSSASSALITDGSKNIVSSSVSATELGHLDGATGNIQDQLDLRAVVTGFGAPISGQLSKPVIIVGKGYTGGFLGANPMSVLFYVDGQAFSFKDPPVVLAQITGDNGFVNIYGVTVSQFSIKTYGTGGSAGSRYFYWIAIGEKP